MNREKRLRRVVLVAAAFMRNVAHNRAFGPLRDRVPKNHQWDFWITLAGNSLDIAVLEWCKLMAENRGMHHWSNVVTDPSDFESRLLGDLGLSVDEWSQYIRSVRDYRDKFIAHLDSDEVFSVPHLELAERSVRLYHAHVVTSEASGAHSLHGLPASEGELSAYYELQLQTATTNFSSALAAIVR
jgi:hypothetical protein